MAWLQPNPFLKSNWLFWVEITKFCEKTIFKDFRNDMTYSYGPKIFTIQTFSSAIFGKWENVTVPKTKRHVFTQHT